MPHGAGHAGGGHHHGGGGHHHGHHHHSHWRHNHHANYPYGGVYYYRRRCTVCSFFGCSIFGVAITLAVILSLRFTFVGEVSVVSNSYAPNDTRPLSYSDVFCDSLSIEKTDDGFPHLGMQAHLYIVKEKPALTEHDSFQVSNSLTLPARFYEPVSFYLYAGSNFQIAACQSTTTSALAFYLIRGSGNLSSWVDSSSSYYAITSFDITSTCGSGNDTYSYQVSKEGDYFLILLNNNNFLFGDDITVQYTYDFYRTKYSFNESAVVNSCDIHLDRLWDSCQLGLDLGAGRSALLVVDASANRTQNIDINVSCGSRIWVYAAISVSVLVAVLVVLTAIIATCVFVYKRRQKRYAPLEGTNPTAAVEVPKNDTTINPSPYNPTYGSTAPPPYGPK